MGYAAKEVRRLMGRAIHQKEMILDGDHVLVAVSGGKDSLSLLRLLSERLKRVPIDYRITAVHVDPGFGSGSGRAVEEYFKENGVEYRIIHSDIGPRAHSMENRENPCFMCSRLRRKILFETAAELRCSKVAMGHHKDDMIETFFLNLFYGASLSTMLPVQDFFDGRITLIRPFFMVEEGLISRYAQSMNLPEIDLGCPSAGSSKREEIKKMLASFYRSNRKIRGNIFHALHNVRTEYLP
ncbi:MAG TPA: tRNA 2-thiocytidine(32) synthetase TtcA [Desulfobacteraceae bacterium]|nr:tRNA 2-thiocytidine(32) synthetase TtcA [Desulfobacteraceae bacterium]